MITLTLILICILVEIMAGARKESVDSHCRLVDGHTLFSEGERREALCTVTDYVIAFIASVDVLISVRAARIVCILREGCFSH